jgi:hypothetical protein
MGLFQMLSSKTLSINQSYLALRHVTIKRNPRTLIHHYQENPRLPSVLDLRPSSKHRRFVVLELKSTQSFD